MAVQAVCPACGAELVFTTDAPLRVCDHCRTVIARRDRGLENLGKVVDLVPSRSPLELGLAGRYLDRPFTLVGHAQLAHPKGGIWDEWYAAFDDGRWGWLAEAEGRFTMMFALPAEGIPALDGLAPGTIVPNLPGGAWRVAEKSRGTRRGAAGELPFRLVPGESFDFVDLRRPGGEAATLDYGDATPAFYAGRELSLADLGWARRAAAERVLPTVKADKLVCPECDGALELRAPDQTQRVGCPYCGALLDVSDGKLSKLAMLDRGTAKPKLPLGGKGTLEGVEWTVVGLIIRAPQAHHRGWAWEEYLLYQPQAGFRWLVCAQGHWSFVTPISVGDVTEATGGPSYRGQSYRPFLAGSAYVLDVFGECTWKVEPGEQVTVTDAIAPPYMLSSEFDETEVNWSRGVYLPVATVAKAFAVELPAPIGVAPHQPYPHPSLWGLWGALVAAAFALAVVLPAVRGTHVAFDQRVTFEGAGSVFFSEPFELAGGRNLAIDVEAPVDNGWFYVAGDLVDESTGEVQSWDGELERYRGVESGEAWSEDASAFPVFLSALPPGRYVLRLEAQSSPDVHEVTVRVREGVVRGMPILILFLLLSVPPIALAFRKAQFEKQRWSQSDFGGDDGDEDDDEGEGSWT